MSVTIAMHLLARIECEDRDPEWSLAFVHLAEPKSKARARVVRGRTGKMTAYTPGETSAAQEHLALSWRMATRGKTADGCLAIACVFYRPNRQRIDIDNMVKLVLDAGTKARVWYDDSQLVTIVARLELDPARPRTEIALMPSVSSLDRAMFKTQTCPGCKQEFTRKVSATVTIGQHAEYLSKSGFCSNACAQHARREISSCARVGCDTTFVRARPGQRYCSRSCSASQTRAESIASGKRAGPPLCKKCGARVSRREYRQCAKCLGRGRPKGSVNAVAEVL